MTYTKVPVARLRLKLSCAVGRRRRWPTQDEVSGTTGEFAIFHPLTLRANSFDENACETAAMAIASAASVAT